MRDAEDFLCRRRYPDLMVAFDVDPEAHRASNGYIIADQGKPPDFDLEVASQSTGGVDVGPRRDDYEWFGISEYWRFDETSAFHGARLAGDRLVAGKYAPTEIAEGDDGSLRAYSAMLDVELRWRDGRLEWLDPRTGRHIPTFHEERAEVAAERARADAERSYRILADRRADAERARAENADLRAKAERACAQNADERLRRLEVELRGLRGQ